MAKDIEITNLRSLVEKYAERLTKTAGKEQLEERAHTADAKAQTAEAKVTDYEGQLQAWAEFCANQKTLPVRCMIYKLTGFGTRIGTTTH